MECVHLEHIVIQTQWDCIHTIVLKRLKQMFEAKS
jgi:hypothetical protein